LWIERDGSGSYATPEHVFWAAHPFGRFRVKLGEGLAILRRLLDCLGVRSTPDCNDAVAVLSDIARQFGPSNLPLDPEALQVVETCWALVSTCLREGTIGAADLASLLQQKVVPNRDGVLLVPERAFLEDRADIAAQFQHRLHQNLVEVRPGVSDAWR